MKDYKSKLDKILGKNINPSSKPSLWHKLYEDAPVSMPAAPVAPSRPTTKPLTSPGTKPSTKPSPLSPKINPGALPKPRAQRDGINEAYEEFVNPGTQKLFKSGDSRFGFSQHPMMKAHGDKIARAAYKHSTGKVYSSMAELEGLSANDKRNRLGQMTMRALQEIKRIETAHATALEEIAIDVVANLYNLGDEDKNKLNAFLRRPQHDAPQEEEDDDGVEEFADDEGDDITHEVHKRHSMNLMSQGAAIHNMHDVHLQDEIKDRLDALDPGLVDLYSQFGRGSSHTYWLYDMNMMLNVQLGGAMGSVNLTPSGEVIAQAPIFPVLVQELIKGVIMLISHHQFESMSPAKTRKIIAAADTLHDEFPQIMVGPKVWRAFILALPSAYRGRLMEVVMTLARAHPKELNIIMVKLGECIANDEDPRTSSVASALQDLLERTLSEETPEGIAAMLPDGDDEFDTGDDEFGTDDEDDDRLHTESWGRNIALAAGAVGSMMGIGGPAGAQTPRPQPSLTASEKAQLNYKSNSRSGLQNKMAEAGKFNKDAYKVGVRASHVSSQIMNTLVRQNAFNTDGNGLKQEYGKTGLFLFQTMDILDAMHKDTSGESHDELLEKLLRAYRIDKNSDAYFGDGSINYKEALRMISNTATSLATKVATTKNP